LNTAIFLRNYFLVQGMSGSRAVWLLRRG
jgi:hypothetical protein